MRAFGHSRPRQETTWPSPIRAAVKSSSPSHDGESPGECVWWPMHGDQWPSPIRREGADDQIMYVLAYIAAILTGTWGVAHAVPTRKVLAGFAPITIDNRRVLLQEWLAEAVAMWGIAALVVVVTVVDAHSEVTAWVYRVGAGLLIALAALTALTGARTPTIWFKICPVLLGMSAALLLIASFA